MIIKYLLLLLFCANIFANETVSTHSSTTRNNDLSKTTHSPSKPNKFSNILSNPAIMNLLKSDTFSSFRKLALYIAFDTSECAKDLKQLMASLGKKEYWALRMLDATSKIPSGILQGNINDLGNYDECLYTKKQVNNKNIQGKYCLASIPLGMNNMLMKKFGRDLAMKINLRAGICVPHSCSAEKLNTYFSTVLKKYNVSVIFDEEKCSFMKQPEYKTIDCVIISFFASVGILLILGTIYEIYVKICNENVRTYKLLLAFSLYTNFKKLLTIVPQKNDNNTLTCLNGIRVISIAWIIYCHSNLLAVVYPAVNAVDELEFSRSWRGQFVMAADVSVDTFLFMSGVLVAYVLVKKFNRGKRILLIPYVLLHRYLRLTAALLAVILFHISLTKYLVSGPVHQTAINQLETPCISYWWSALLYVQNYVNPEHVCVGPSWYLSVDMQLFFIAPFLIILFGRFKKLVFPTLLTLTIMSSVFTFVVAWIYEIPTIDNSKDVPKFFIRFIKLYVPTHTRAGPWFIGMALGYFLHKHRERKFVMNWGTVIAGWCISISTFVGIILMHHPFIQADYEYNKYIDPSFLAVHRVLWSLGLCWVVIACEYGYGGPINALLSCPLFQPLARLTYGQYLIHFALQHMTVSSMRQPPFVSMFLMFYHFVSDYILTLLLSAILSVSFESPIISIEKILRGEAPSKSKEGIENQENRSNIKNVDKFACSNA